MAEGRLLFKRRLTSAAHTMALFPVVGVARRGRPAGKHGPLRGQQLLDTRLLAKLASELQPLDRPVGTECEVSLIQRYIYIPVGGSKNVVVATLLAFTFVALWHDLSFKLLAWGWLVTLFILPELLARAVLPQEKVRSSRRHVLIAVWG